METLGYGIGIGPPGLGVLQTSGIVAVETPELPLCDKDNLLITMVSLIAGLFAASG
jgi:hypothetical protein